MNSDQNQSSLRERIIVVEQSVKSHEARLSESRQWTLALVALITTVYSAAAIVFSFNLDAERQELAQFKEQVTEEISIALGKSLSVPSVELYSLDRRPLSQSTILATVERDVPNEKYLGEEPPLVLSFQYVMKNVGDASTGPVHTKFYASDPIKLLSPSSDEIGFSYESHITPIQNSPFEFPAGASGVRFITLGLNMDSPPDPGVYPVLLKTYYGRNQVVETKFFVKLG